MIHVKGDLTVMGAELLIALTDKFVRDGCRSVRMDLAGVTTADDAGLRAVKELRTSLANQGTSLHVYNGSSAVHAAAGLTVLRSGRSNNAWL
jgi:anti-anti-sigma regulatory factor